MKIKYLFFGFAAFLAVGCVNEDLNPTPTTNGVRVFADMPSTRVSFGEGDGVTHVTWQNGDVISLSTDIQSNLQYTAGVGEEGSTVTEFLPVGDNLQNNYKKVVYACYPSAVIDMENMTVPLPNTQNYNDLEFRPFVYAIDTILDDRLELHFHHPYAYLKLTFTEGILPPDTISIGAVKIASDEVIAATSGKFNFVTQAVEAAEGSKTMFIERLGGDGSGHVLKDSPYTLYVPVLPQSEGTKIAIQACYTIGTGLENCYPYYTMEKTVPVGGFQAGHVYTLTMDERDEPIGREPGIYNLDDWIALFRPGEHVDWQYVNQDGVVNIFADIDMSTVTDWSPIRYLEQITLEGNGHSIYNLNISVKNNHWALICETNYVAIRNLTIRGQINIEEVDFYGGDYGSFGVFCCFNWGGTISNCHSYVDVNSVGNDTQVGGICCYNTSIVENCSNYGNIQTSTAGGIIYSVSGNGKVVDCTNYGTLKTTKMTLSPAGDMYPLSVGGIAVDAWQGTITGCVNEGEILSDGASGNFSGICASTSESVISNCQNNGEIVGGSFAGGIIGSVRDDNLQVKDCKNAGKVTAEVAGGICGVVTRYDDVTPLTGIVISGNENAGTVTGTDMPGGGICGYLLRMDDTFDFTNNMNGGTVDGVAGTDANAVGKDDRDLPLNQ